jgi:outer membrane protein assembly factor BamB
VLYKDLVIFGSYDGNVYALERESGKKRWVSFEADWVGSSPTVAHDLELVFVGLEFGLFRRHGGIVALNANTGETVWMDDTHPAYTHSSPYYIEEHRQVVIGSNDGKVRLYDAPSGKKIWEFTVEGGKVFDLESNARFGKGDIKESFAYDRERDYLIFGSIDNNLYIIERATGKFVYRHECLFGIYSTALIHKNHVYFTSVDKHIRSLNLDTFELSFEKNLDGTRIFSSPTVINDRLYVGTNAARLHELDLETGKQLGYFQALERITNSVVYSKDTDIYYLPTYANEIICLKRTDD